MGIEVLNKLPEVAVASGASATAIRVKPATYDAILSRFANSNSSDNVFVISSAKDSRATFGGGRALGIGPAKFKRLAVKGGSGDAAIYGDNDEDSLLNYVESNQIGEILEGTNIPNLAALEQQIIAGILKNRDYPIDAVVVPERNPINEGVVAEGEMPVVLDQDDYVVMQEGEMPVVLDQDDYVVMQEGEMPVGFVHNELSVASAESEPSYPDLSAFDTGGSDNDHSSSVLDSLRALKAEVSSLQKEQAGLGSDLLVALLNAKSASDRRADVQAQLDGALAKASAMQDKLKKTISALKSDIDETKKRIEQVSSQAARDMADIERGEITIGAINESIADSPKHM